MEVRKIPPGKHFAYFRQFNAFDAMQPVRLQSNIWVMPESAIDYIENQYLNATQHTKDNHPGIVKDVLDSIDFTVNETRKLNSIDINEKVDLHERYKRESTKEEIFQQALEIVTEGQVDETKTIAELKAELQVKDIEKQPIRIRR